MLKYERIRKLVGLLILLLFGQLSFAQLTIAWEKSYGGSYDDIATSISPTSDGGYIVSGYSFSDDGDVGTHNGTTGFSDYWIIKITNTGELEWEHALGGTKNDLAYSVEETETGEFIVVGKAHSTDGDISNPNGDIWFSDNWMVKLSDQGELITEESIGNSSYDSGNVIKRVDAGGFIIAGYNHSADGDVSGNHGFYDFWVIKLSSTGTVDWQQAYGGSDSERAESIIETSDGGFIVAGYTGSEDGDVSDLNTSGDDYWIIKLSSQGEIQWEQTYGGSSTEWAYSIQETSDGGFITAGYSYSSDGDVNGHYSGKDYWVVKMSSEGEIQWQKVVGGNAQEEARSVIETVDGGYLVAGFSQSSSDDIPNPVGGFGNYDYWLVKLSNEGDLIWQQSYGGTSHDKANSMIQTIDGGIILAGSSDSNNIDVSENQGGSDFWIVKLEGESVGISEKASPSFSIAPNPTREKIDILAGAELLGSKFSIYNQLGIEVAIGVIDRPNASIDVHYLPKGIYLVQVASDTGTYSARLVLE